MEPDIRRDVRLLLFTGVRSHDSGECPNKGCFGKLLIHFADCLSASFGFNKSVLVRASPRPIHCCQSNGAGYPKGCPAPLVYGYPLARQRACRTSPELQAHYPLRGLMYNNERPHSALNYEPPSSRRRPHGGDTNQFNLESINPINNNINQVTLLLLLPALIWGTQQFKPP